MLREEFLLKDSGQVGGPVEYGYGGEFAAFLNQPLYLSDYPFRLFLLGLSVVVHDLQTVRRKGEQCLRDAVYIVGNHAVGNVENVRCGTVVLIQDNVFVGCEVHEARWPGTSPFIYALVRVADDEEIVMPGGELLDDFPVVRIAVLSLVHHYIVELALPIILHLGKILQQVYGEVLDIVEVQGVVLHLPSCVGSHA